MINRFAFSCIAASSDEMMSAGDSWGRSTLIVSLLSLAVSVTTNLTAEWVARQIAEAFPWDEAPHYLIRDRDRIYGTIVIRGMRAMGIRDKPTAPASPWQNGFAERLIGSIRRERVDHATYTEMLLLISFHAHAWRRTDTKIST